MEITTPSAAGSSNVDVSMVAETSCEVRAPPPCTPGPRPTPNSPPKAMHALSNPRQYAVSTYLPGLQPSTVLYEQWRLGKTAKFMKTIVKPRSGRRLLTWVETIEQGMLEKIIDKCECGCGGFQLWRREKLTLSSNVDCPTGTNRIIPDELDIAHLQKCGLIPPNCRINGPKDLYAALPPARVLLTLRAHGFLTPPRIQPDQTQLPGASPILNETLLNTSAGLLQLTAPEAARGWRWIKVDERLWNSRFVGENLEADRNSGREVVRNAAKVEWDAWVWGTDDDGGKYGMLLILNTSW